MAQLPSQKRLSREDFKGAPSWIDVIIITMNSFMESVYAALNRNLTFVDNVRSSVRTIKFTTAATYVSQSTWTVLEFPTGLNGIKVSGLLLMQLVEDTTNFTPIKSAVFIDWQEISGQIQIQFISGLQASTNYRIKVLVV